MAAAHPVIDQTAFLAAGAIVLGEVRIGRESSVWYHTVIRGDAERIVIGSQTNLQDLTMVHADPAFPCLVGSRVTVGHRVILHGCVVGVDCLIGMGAILLNGVHVGAGSVVGAGALLKEGQQVPPGSVVVGMPGRVVRQVDAAMRERIEHGWRHYVLQARRHEERLFPPAQPSDRG
jgi:carbonic anhydrase/acetyltransferase-like protein (isoleucine patch superfamily)